MGGTDDPSNLIELSVEEHAEEHRKLYELHGKKEDYIAWKCLLGVMSVEEKVREHCSMAGKKGGATNRESGHMARLGKNMPIDERLCYIRKGIEIQREAQSGSFFDPEILAAVRKKGGQSQGKVNAENGHLTRIANRYWEEVKSGQREPRRKKFWVTNGNDEMTIFVDDMIPDGFWRGRKAGIGRRSN